MAYFFAAMNNSSRPFLSGGGKLAEQIARQLEREIVSAGWPIGQRLGNEESLVQRFGVSRWIVREAIAMTDRDGMTQRLRSRLGGLAVAARSFLQGNTARCGRHGC